MPNIRESPEAAEPELRTGSGVRPWLRLVPYIQGNCPEPGRTHLAQQSYPPQALQDSVVG